MFFASLAGFSQKMPQICGCKVMKVTPFALLAWVAVSGASVPASAFAMSMWLTVIGAMLSGFGSACCCTKK
jgi:hypothetical protein